MELAISLDLAGWVLLIVGALAFGVVAQFIGETRTNFEWVVDAIGFFVGALVASEFVIAWQTFEPVYGGLAIVPALVGGLIVGLIAEVATRTVTGGTYSGQTMSA
jgi:uncharacterized membrane protein YeaQ/YmgE (transglycosylase-associated protein family)